MTSDESSSNTASSPSPTTIDNEKLQQFMGKVLSDLGGAASAILVYIGDKIGLYKAMYNFAKPITSQELANLTSTSERYIREWLANQTAGGYLRYDPSSQRYRKNCSRSESSYKDNKQNRFLLHKKFAKWVVNASSIYTFLRSFLHKDSYRLKLTN
jgi:hypothetical protein